MKKNKTENNFEQVRQFLLTSPSVLWCLLILITVFFTATHTSKGNRISYAYNLGDVAQRDIKAHR
ncbi:MAG: hypothetical protein KJ760_08365, partial [Proteobacteria bacterium]|nr:hypothetical protein [Pseudomonadota bacterium]